MFIIILFTIAKTWKQTKCPPTDDWFNMCHIHRGILLCHNKERNTTICSNMDEPREYHTEVSHKTNTI